MISQRQLASNKTSPFPTLPSPIMTDQNMESSFATAKTVVTGIASVAASIVLIRSVAKEIVPPEFYDFISSKFHNFMSHLSPTIIVNIKENEGYINNKMFEAAELYMGTLDTGIARRLRVMKEEKDKSFTISADQNEEVVDVFKGVKFTWTYFCEEIKPALNSYGSRTATGESRYLEMSFDKKYKKLALESYLPRILSLSDDVKRQRRSLKLYSVENIYNDPSNIWTSITLDHPATFQTLAMDENQKKEIMDDLKRFLNRKEFYRKVGKPWKRGYLLYGPPGTGKSSLIAAMANFLNFDIYDLELTSVSDNSELRKALVGTTNRSILVVEDIDCSSANLTDRSSEDDGESKKEKVTLSGVLNVVDGLWSSVGDERIIVFTTNHKDKLDPALVRPGRMDMHIHMGYCTFSGFKTLISNYHDVNSHETFDQVRSLLDEVEITPAELAEELMRTDQDRDEVMGLVLRALEKKKEERKAKEKEAKLGVHDDKARKKEEPELGLDDKENKGA